jgi:hypothetical protein
MWALLVAVLMPTFQFFLGVCKVRADSPDVEIPRHELGALSDPGSLPESYAPADLFLRLNDIGPRNVNGSCS